MHKPIVAGVSVFAAVVLGAAGISGYAASSAPGKPAPSTANPVDHSAVAATKHSLGLPLAHPRYGAMCPHNYVAQAPAAPSEADGQDPTTRGLSILTRAVVIDSAGNPLLLRSGSVSSDKTTGVIEVVTLVADPCATPDARVSVQFYPVHGHGAIKLTSTSGDVVYLQFADGGRGTFNARTRYLGS